MAEFQDEREQGATLRDFLSVLFRRKWIVIVVVAATVGFTVRNALTMTPVFRSYSTLLVSRGQTTTAYNSSIRLLSWEEEISSELETIRSARIYLRAQEILDAEGAQDSSGAAIKINPAKVDANTPGKTHVIHILYQSVDRSVVQPAVRALTSAYEEFRTDIRTQDPTVFLAEEIDQLRTEIGYWEQRRADFLVNAGSVELPQERNNMLAAKRNLETELAGARTEVAERQAVVDQVKEVLAVPGGEELSLPEDAWHSESMLGVLHRRIIDTKAAYLEAKAQYTDNHPKVLSLRGQLDEMSQAMKEESNLYLQGALARLQVARAKETSLQSSLDYLDSELRAYPDREAQLASLDRTIQSLRTTHDALVQRRAEAISTRLGASPWDVVVLQDAVKPFRVGRVDYIRMAVIPIFAIFVAVGLAFLFDGLDQTFREIKEVEGQLKLPSLAAIRHFRR